MAAEDGDQQQAMDRMYRLQRHIYDLTRKYYLLGRDHLIAELQAPEGAQVLELGCGTGRNLIAAARAYPAAQFLGIDISDEMLKTARASIAKAGLSGRVEVAQGDATAVAASSVPEAVRAAGGFDRVFISYALSMIPPWREALEEGLRLTRPGGRLSVVDFGPCDRLPGGVKSILYGWLDRFHVYPREDLAEAMETVAQDKGGAAQVEALYRGYAVYGSILKP